MTSSSFRRISPCSATGLRCCSEGCFRPAPAYEYRVEGEVQRLRPSHGKRAVRVGDDGLQPTAREDKGSEAAVRSSRTVSQVCRPRIPYLPVRSHVARTYLLMLVVGCPVRFNAPSDFPRQVPARSPPPPLPTARPAPDRDSRAMAELDNTEARSVVAFLTKAGRQPDDMLRFFDRKDYFCLVGRDADTVAVEYFKSTACIKHVQSGGERRSYLSINKKMASEVMRAALLEQRRRVKAYRPCGKGRLAAWACCQAYHPY